jgi:hypothetical protein
MILKPPETIDDLRKLLLDQLIMVGLTLICFLDNLDGVSDWRSMKLGLTNMLFAGGAKDIRVKRLDRHRSRSGLTRVVSLSTELHPDAFIYCAIEVYATALPQSVIDEMESTDLPVGSILRSFGIIATYQLIECFCVHAAPEGPLWGNGRGVILSNEAGELIARSVAILNSSAQSIFSLEHNGTTDSR